KLGGHPRPIQTKNAGSAATLSQSNELTVSSYHVRAGVLGNECLTQSVSTSTYPETPIAAASATRTARLPKAIFASTATGTAASAMAMVLRNSDQIGIPYLRPTECFNHGPGAKR